ncbi:hypothetical protein OIU76_019534 [Salix suchowensis]|uniref:Uncharacterized protein n=1 Tax=Salix suchowensis TaxID=1278906 RepID=A0ABQ8ZJ43_9ROSI|nr:hypothetical protein OIU76_019534 [Salix suchowensis]KAJ6301808.1 hypothetical protein OIU77_016011 [Salix suchowensis]KAJ6314492.1 hypothetical protein OIU78_018051 [Salix suchowensis]
MGRSGSYYRLLDLESANGSKVAHVSRLLDLGNKQNQGFDDHRKLSFSMRFRRLRAVVVAWKKLAKLQPLQTRFLEQVKLENA